MERGVWAAVSVLLAFGVVVPIACSGKSGSDSTASGGGGVGGKASTSSSVAQTSSSTTAGSGGAVPDAACDAPAVSPSKGTCYKAPQHNCGGGSGGSGGAGSCGSILDTDDCFDCVEQKCCAQLDACSKNKDCIDCFKSGDLNPTKCQASGVKKLIDDLELCLECSCAKVCDRVQCNPVTNEPCGAGEGCDYGPWQGFVCWSEAALGAKLDAKICEKCGYTEQPFCAPGLTCLEDDNFCARFCCDDKDCGKGYCEIYEGDTVGVCLHN
jgi:hypothetical protein